MKMMYKNAIAQYRHHWKQAALSSLGVMIAALSLVVAGHLSQMASTAIMRQFETLGGHNVSVFINGDLSYQEIADQISNIPQLKDFYTLKESYLNLDGENIPIIGSSATTQTALNLSALDGRLLHKNDTQPYAVVTQDLFAQYKHTLSLNTQLIAEHGIIEIIGTSDHFQIPFGSPFHNGFIFVSDETFSELFPGKQNTTLVLIVNDFDQMETVSNVVKDRLNSAYPDVHTGSLSPQQMLKSMQYSLSMTKAIIYLMVCICSLLGGIGIMNMTLANINSRHTELALRVSFGATLKQINHMLLLEISLLCIGSATLGIVLGLICVKMIAIFNDWPYIILYETIINSLIFSLLVGILSSLYPARIIRKIPLATILKGE